MFLEFPFTVAAGNGSLSGCTDLHKGTKKTLRKKDAGNDSLCQFLSRNYKGFK